MEKNFTPGALTDLISVLDGGMQSGWSPYRIPKNQVAFAWNCSFRGGFAKHRPPITKKTITYGGDATLQAFVEGGKFQGGGYYLPDFGTESLVAQISGRLFQFTEQSDGTWLCIDVSVPGDFNNPSVNQVWMWQSEKWLIIRDGTTALPIFFDGTKSRRSYGLTHAMATVTALQAGFAVGDSATLQISGSYTGPLDVPVIINGEYYNINSSNQLSNGNYNAALTNISDIPGTTVPVSSAVVVESTFTNNLSAQVVPTQQSELSGANQTRNTYAGFDGLGFNNAQPYTVPIVPITGVPQPQFCAGSLNDVGKSYFTAQIDSNRICSDNLCAGTSVVGGTFWGGSGTLNFSNCYDGVSFFVQENYTTSVSRKISAGTIVTIPLKTQFQGKVGDVLNVKATQSYYKNGVLNSVNQQSQWTVVAIIDNLHISAQLNNDITGVTEYNIPGGVPSTVYAVPSNIKVSASNFNLLTGIGQNGQPIFNSIPGFHYPDNLQVLAKAEQSNLGYPTNSPMSVVQSPVSSGKISSVNPVVVNNPWSYLQISTTPDSVSNGSDIVLAVNSDIGLSVTVATATVGIVQTAFTVPAVNSSANVLLSSLFTGQQGMTVYIGTARYTITSASPPPPVNQLVVTNITDLGGTGGLVGKDIPAGYVIMSVPELPSGKMGAYGNGRNWLCNNDGLSYTAGDIVGGGSGTSAYNFRDAVLRMTENTFLQNGGSFKLPGAGDTITSMFFPSVMDTSLGVGPLQVATQRSIFSNNAPPDRTTWNALSYPISTQTSRGRGPLAQDSTIAVNADTFFRTYDGISTLVIARREFAGWGNKPISNEIKRILKDDDQSLLSYGSAIFFDNRFIVTARPYASPGGVIHTGLATLDFDIASTFTQDANPAWEGAWVGPNTLKLLNGRVNGTDRAFIFSWNSTTQKIEILELLSESTEVYSDDGSSIPSIFETAVLFNKDVKPPTELIQLRDGEFYVQEIQGFVDIKVFYRPDFYPCWTLWKEVQLQGSDPAQNIQPGYRMRVGLGEPSVEDYELGNNRPLRNGYFFQFRIEITGSCKWMSMMVSAITVPSPVFAPVECELAPSQNLNCTVNADLPVFDVTALPPLQPTTQQQALTYVNDTVYYDANCGTGKGLVSFIPLPSWITINGSQLVGAGSVFTGISQNAANNSALSALQDFANTNLGSGNLICFGCGGAPALLTDLSWVITPSDNPSKNAISLGSDNAHLYIWQGQDYPNNHQSSAVAQFCNSTNKPVTIRASWVLPVGGADCLYTGIPTSYFGTLVDLDHSGAFSIISVNGMDLLNAQTPANGGLIVAPYECNYPSDNTSAHVDIIVPAYSTQTITVVSKGNWNSYTQAPIEFKIV